MRRQIASALVLAALLGALRSSTPDVAAQQVVADIVRPAAGSILPGENVTFSWTGNPVVEQYWLYLGTSAGSNDLLSWNAGRQTSVAITGLPTTGLDVFAVLWFRIGPNWATRTYRYETSDGCTNVPDRPGGFNFKPSCVQHDICYRTWAFATTKDSCDNEFHANLLAECGGYLAIADRSACQSWADTYYDFVRDFGSSSYYSAQCRHAADQVLRTQRDWYEFCLAR